MGASKREGKYTPGSERRTGQARVTNVRLRFWPSPVVAWLTSVTVPRLSRARVAGPVLTYCSTLCSVLLRQEAICPRVMVQHPGPPLCPGNLAMPHPALDVGSLLDTGLQFCQSISILLSGHSKKQGQGKGKGPWESLVEASPDDSSLQRRGYDSVGSRPADV